MQTLNALDEQSTNSSTNEMYVAVSHQTQDVGNVKSGDELYPDLSNLTTTKIPHHNLILDGVCTHCAHCGHQLTDSISVQRGIGPICSKKGYSEDPIDGDEMQAMIDLAEFPELVEFLTVYYKPLGIRGLVNGLVRAASLNRPHGTGMLEGNYKVHAACCDAIESLGHKKMAQLLRETLVVVRMDKYSEDPAFITVLVKKRDMPDWWFNSLRRDISNLRWDNATRTHIVRIYQPGGSALLAVSTRPDGISNKLALWNMILKAFPNMILKNQDGQNIRIRKPRSTSSV
jgi:hypothetical protein